MLRDDQFYLNFIRHHPEIGRRTAKIDISDLERSKGLFVAITWSDLEDILYVGDDKGKLASVKAESATR